MNSEKKEKDKPQETKKGSKTADKEKTGKTGEKTAVKKKAAAPAAAGQKEKKTSEKKDTGDKEKKKKPKRKRWRPGWRIKLASFLFPILLIPLVVGVVTYQHYVQDLPSIDALKNYAPKTVSYMYADDGRVIGEFYLEHRIVVPLSKVPGHVISAFVAAEDENFFNHPGVDLIGILRAFIVNLKAGRIVQGGSTITQQVTKSFLLSNEKTYERKIKEALLAWRIEKNLTKEEILFLYLNQIYLGRGAYGVESAARMYFDKHVGDLSIAETAMIAGLTRAPGRYSPFRTPKLARTRQVYVINRMLESGFITFDKAVEAIQEELVFAKRKKNYFLETTPHFTEHVRRMVEKLVGSERFYTEGLRIYTTVNIEAQQTARRAAKTGLAALAKRQGYKKEKLNINKEDWEGWKAVKLLDNESAIAAGAELEGLVIEVDDRKRVLKISTGAEEGLVDSKGMSWALRGRKASRLFKAGDVIKLTAREKKEDVWVFDLYPVTDAQAAVFCMNTATGEVKVAVGGKNFRDSQFNRAVQAKRQPGSSFKPFVYTAAMDSGFTQASVINDYPVVYDDMGGTWSPKNYGRGYGGPTTLYSGLIRSVNVVAVRLLEKVGANKVIEYAHKMGIKSELGPNLSLALGSSEVTLMEMVSAYTTFPNLGEPVAPMFIKRIEDRYGNVITNFSPKKERAVSPETAYIVLDMLRGVVLYGTGRRVSALGRPVAGKTGTTNDQADAWFIGFTPGWAAGAWVGKDQRKTLGRGEQGGRTAAPIFLAFMKEFMKDKPERKFSIPKGVVRTGISTSTVDEEGEEQELYQYLVFKKGQVGRGRSEEPIIEPTIGDAEDGETQAAIEDRMKKYLEKYQAKKKKEE